MVWNTIAHPKMMTTGNTAGVTIMKNRPLLSVDTAKQSFYDFILNLQVVGYEEIEDKSGTQSVPIIKPVLVHGNYRDVYNKLMNASLVIGAQVSLLTNNVAIVGQVNSAAPPLVNITAIYIMKDLIIPETGLPATVGGMPLIAMDIDGNMIVYLDCLNRVWVDEIGANIPFDT